MSDQKSLIDRVSRVTGDMAGNPVVSATKQRAQKASRVARSQLPATREDVARIQEQLDRVEATLAELAGRIESTAKPRRRPTSGSAKAEG